jgi:RNA polymerase sigma-54 factor
MAMHQKLGLQARLSQKLILTPSLQQAIKLLPMSTLELKEYIEQEITENPFLEADAEPRPTGEDPPNAEALQEKVQQKEEPPEDSFSDLELEAYTSDYLETSHRLPSNYEAKELPPLENRLATVSSLTEHLERQLPFLAVPPLTREIAERIVGNLDSNGYLQATVEEIADMGSGSGYPIEEVEKALSLVQSLDPPGVAARSLQECLLIQIRLLGLDGTLLDTMIRDHMELLEKRQYQELAKALNFTVDEILVECEALRRLLDPHPGARYNPQRTQYVTPDVYVKKVDDKYQILLSEDRLPQLRISALYKRMLQDKQDPHNEEARAYLKDKQRSALWLIKSVDQRQKTIYKVAESIVRHQREFLDNGADHLKPLVLRDVAMDIGMHESTVSRVVNNKYIHTPQGVYEMRYFFHSGIASTYGESVSSVTIKRKIKKIVAEEQPQRPLSDAKIARILEREGLVLARRTIAKYREELRIPPSNQRKNLYTYSSSAASS